MHPLIETEQCFGAHNYHPLPVVLTKGEGVYVWDDQGKKYIDMMSAYSAVSHGHCHPKLIETLKKQAETLTMVSRAFYSDQLGPFLQKVCEMTGFEKALPMNTGAEAVETALKAVRKWAYTVKGVSENAAEVIVCQGNFHGRTIAIVGFSSEKNYKQGFGPFPAGFKIIPYNDVKALAEAITPNTAAFLVEPIQGEGGIVVPEANYLKQCEEICRQNNVLLIADEIQTGLGRTGKLLACDHEQVKPDGVLLGKALGGGILPVSLFLTRKEVMDVFTPGDHGSTFGGNPLGAALASKALDLLFEENLISNANKMGEYFKQGLTDIRSPIISEVRGKGLMLGLVINSNHYSARDVCLKLLKQGILCKETHETVVRLAPPLMINQKEIDQAVKAIKVVITEMEAMLST